jgi:hypothetical protein
MIYKSKQTEKFTVLPNVIFEELNDGLAIGILAYLLSKPSDWVTYKNQIHDHFSEGRDRINKSFKLLQDKGFIVGVKKVDSTGKFTGYEWIVYNEPVINSDKNHNTENRLTENRNTETCQLLNKENTKERNTKNNIEERKKNFAHSLKPFLEEYGKNTLNDFYFYWTEHGENDKKMRFEKQTSFNISLRLKNWVRNDKSKNNFKKSNVLFVTPEGIEITDPHVLYTYQQTGKI